MASIETLIQGSNKLTAIFGFWPSFHDAEVIDLHLWRGHIDGRSESYVPPVLRVKLHLWELTKDVDERGSLRRRHHTLATLRFDSVEEFTMDGFNHQNAIFGLSIEQQKRLDGPSPFFAVRFEPAFGIDASFRCLRVEVVDAAPCSEDGEIPCP